MIELLTVIAIIAILAALLFPAIKKSLLKAEIAKTQQGVNSLQTAFHHYYTEYGRWPVSPPPGGWGVTYPEILVSTKLYGLLKGEDVPGPAGGSTPGGTDANSATIVYNGNPRHIAFLEFKTSDLSVPTPNVITNFADSWGSPYRCIFDVAYANSIPNPFMITSPNNIINAGVIVWSPGGPTRIIERRER